MVFDSVEFFFFLFVVYGLYLALDKQRQNVLLLLASYFFYACWDWRFLGLIWLSTLVDYYCGAAIHSSDSASRRKRFLWLSLLTNLGILGCFKYFNFFTDSLAGLVSMFGITLDPLSLSVILPVGISFYTFQSLSYTIDIYRGTLKPTKSPLAFFLFVAFFPQLVAGPIERARRLLPQIEKARVLNWEKIYTGTWLISWGLFQKVYVADNVGVIVNRLFSDSADYNGAEVLVASYAFSIQLLCDFAGYSNMAKGVASLLGFNLTTNFRYPYFSSNLREFWTRWHVSLSRWFRDYVYRAVREMLPGSQKWQIAASMIVTFTLIGLWHGASWNYVLWGFLTSLQFVVYLAIAPWLRRVTRSLGNISRAAFRVMAVLLVYHLWCLGCPLFRGESLAQALAMYQALVFNFKVTGEAVEMFYQLAIYSLVFLAVERYQYMKDDPLAPLKLPVPGRAIVYLTMFYCIVWFGKLDGTDYIYFQF